MNTTKRNWIEAHKKRFFQYFGKTPVVTAVAPGRINLIGEHTDYNEGLSLPAAIDRWIATSIYPLSDSTRIEIQAPDMSAVIRWDSAQPFTPASALESYGYGAVELIRPLLSQFSGAYILIEGTIPIGSGISSSAALEVSLIKALLATEDVQLDPIVLAQYCQQVEHQFVNVKSGLLDPLASIMGLQGHALRIDFSQLSTQIIPLEWEHCSVVLCHSMVQRSLASSEYSKRVDECEAGFKEIQLNDSSVLRKSDIRKEHLPIISNERNRRRWEHVVNENQRVDLFIQAVQHQQWEQMKTILHASHMSLQHLYEVSCMELDFLVDTAYRYPTLYGARMMGGGFGGNILVVLPSSEVPAFIPYIQNAFYQKFKLQPICQVYQTDNGASFL
ncbi:MAG: galactokinase [Cytophagaceae bacterium]|jgi:galactokinase|nr:galactokinase [Cytophagaceae bacterium]